MELYLTATSSVSDLTIDFIEGRLRSGKTVSLNWDASFIDRCGDTISAHYVGVYFNEKSACGKLRKVCASQRSDCIRMSSAKATIRYK